MISAVIIAKIPTTRVWIESRIKGKGRQRIRPESNHALTPWDEHRWKRHPRLTERMVLSTHSQSQREGFPSEGNCPPVRRDRPRDVTPQLLHRCGSEKRPAKQWRPCHSNLHNVVSITRSRVTHGLILFLEGRSGKRANIRVCRLSASLRIAYPPGGGNFRDPVLFSFRNRRGHLIVCEGRSGYPVSATRTSNRTINMELIAFERFQFPSLTSGCSPDVQQKSCRLVCTIPASCKKPAIVQTNVPQRTRG